MTREFLEEIKIPWTKTELTVMFNWKIKTIKESQIKNYLNHANIYYLPWVDPELEDWKRASDNNVIKTNRFCIDIDMRNQFDEEITNLEIVKAWLDFAKYLKDANELFWEFSYIVFSWNWLHIYYHWDTIEIDKNIYKEWVKYILRMWDDFINDPWFFSDHACCNLARILRLPWSYNMKNWAKVRILAKQKVKSRLFTDIEKYANISLEEQKKEEEKKKKELEKKMKLYASRWEDNNLYEKINDIPAYQIAEMLLPEFPFDWKKNFKNKKWWFAGYFYVKEMNWIANWWSRYFNWWDENSVFSPFMIIKNWYWLTNRETFEYFKDKFNL